VGLTPGQAAARLGADKVRVLTRDNESLERPRIDGDIHGFVSLAVHAASGVVLGATVVGARAGEVASELGVAVALKLKVADLAQCVHPFPTHASGVWAIASNAAADAFAHSATGRLGAALSGARSRSRTNSNAGAAAAGH
jgi:pyruvate/2-oxoglutarate dehydrogenase complex dihydrolipoamide dehydrogenase (E3) component